MRSFLLLHEPGDTPISQGDPTHRYNSTSAKKKSFMMQNVDASCQCEKHRTLKIYAGNMNLLIPVNETCTYIYNLYVLAYIFVVCLCGKTMISVDSHVCYGEIQCQSKLCDCI